MGLGEYVSSYNKFRPPTHDSKSAIGELYCI